MVEYIKSGKDSVSFVLMFKLLAQAEKYEHVNRGKDTN